ncbi:MAG: hypothetical protein ACOC78_01635 [Actinomycetota bacterium]
MGKKGKTRAASIPLYPIFLCIGAFAGSAFAFRLDDEQRRRIKKAFSELKELPFRIFI